MISKSIQLMSICSTVNRELQGIHIGCKVYILELPQCLIVEYQDAVTMRW